jgi:hypothetical protein
MTDGWAARDLIERDAARWAMDRQASDDPGPVTAGWDQLTPPERGARIEWLRMLRWQAACTVTDWVEQSTPPLNLPLDSPVRDALAVYRDRGDDLEAVADWVMDYRP